MIWTFLCITSELLKALWTKYIGACASAMGWRGFDPDPMLVATATSLGAF
jgi:hypothetical protein